MADPPSVSRSHLIRLLQDDGRTEPERRRLVDLMMLLAHLPPPPDPVGMMPRYVQLRQGFLRQAPGDDGELLEESFLELYAHLHGYDGQYSDRERARVNQTGGYWNHAGGVSPVIRAAPWIHPHTVSMDLGAGNGLQLLLVQKLFPHALSVQVEISSRLVEAGRHLQRWLGIAEKRVRWVVGDVMEAHLQGVDFIYMYRPLRPEGEGVGFYQRLAGHLKRTTRQVVVFSIADCLRDFVGEDRVFFTDGHLTCFRFPG